MSKPNWNSFLERNKDSGIKIVMKSGIEIDDLKLVNAPDFVAASPGLLEFKSADGVLHVDGEEIAAILIKKTRSF